MNGTAVLTPGGAAGAGDRRRRANAEAHCRGVGLGVLFIHAAAMEKDGAAVALLGGHGAGKSVTALAMAERGWRAVAGDVALVRVTDSETAPILVGGTREFLVRPVAYRRWFAHRAAATPYGEESYLRQDITDSVTWAPNPVGEIPLRLAVSISVDGSVCGAAQRSWLDPHTSASVWYRASSHLLDRVLDDERALPLRCLEHPRLASARMELVRAASRALPVLWMLGTPQLLAGAIEELLARGTDA